MRITRYSQALALVLPLFLGSGVLFAEPPAGTGGATPADAPPGGGQTAAPSGNFFSSVKQAFKQDFDREVVRGHFDVGSPPEEHRYYCLVDAKTGKSEANGVGGQPFLRPDGMTGIKGGAVSFYSCVNAEQQGSLVTAGYVLSASAGSGAGRTTPPVSSGQRQPVVPAHDGAPVDAAVQTEVKSVFARFIAGQNARDRGVVSDLLLDSKDFVWVQYGGNSVWGHKEAMEAFLDAWKGTWKLDPQLNEMRVGNASPGIAVLITPIIFTHGVAGGKPSTVPIRWGGVFDVGVANILDLHHAHRQ